MYQVPVATTSCNFFPPHSQQLSKHYPYSCLSQAYARPESNSRYQEADGGRIQTPLRTSLVDSGISKVTPSYLGAPIRDGLRTPPSDDMNSTAGYPQQSSGWNGQKDNPYTTSYSTHPTGTQQYVSSVQHPRGSTVPVLSSTAGFPAQAYSSSHSSQSTSTAVLKPEDIERRKSGILPSLQIPRSVNDSGRSLGEFAAEVSLW
jgi:hypothetical protein